MRDITQAAEDRRTNWLNRMASIFTIVIGIPIALGAVDWAVSTSHLPDQMKQANEALIQVKEQISDLQTQQNKQGLRTDRIDKNVQKIAIIEGVNIDESAENYREPQRIVQNKFPHQQQQSN